MGEHDRRPSEDHIRRAHELVRILLPALREIARQHGYALAVHGSLERDIDLVAIPWRESATSASRLMRQIFTACDAIMGSATGPQGWTEFQNRPAPSGALPNPDVKAHGRLAWSILFGSGPYLDISVMPIVVPQKNPRKK